MPLALTSGMSALRPSMFTYFLAAGGTAPYVYSVDSGGAGGSIDPTTGLYTAPATISTRATETVDTIRVTDGVAAVATRQIFVGTPILLLCDIIRRELDLSASQVFLWDQKGKITKDSDLSIAVGVVSCIPFANNIRYLGVDAGLNAIQSTNFSSVVSIDVMSRSLAAEYRKEEVLMALESSYARTQQIANSFYLGKLSTSFLNISQGDGGAIPYRFNISVKLQYSVKKVKAVPYYDSFGAPQISTEGDGGDTLVTQAGETITTQGGDPLVVQINTGV